MPLTRPATLHDPDGLLRAIAARFANGYLDVFDRDPCHDFSHFGPRYTAGHLRFRASWCSRPGISTSSSRRSNTRKRVSRGSPRAREAFVIAGRVSGKRRRNSGGSNSCAVSGKGMRHRRTELRGAAGKAEAKRHRFPVQLRHELQPWRGSWSGDAFWCIREVDPTWWTD
jgi:hypothetical protein